jgi:hypothetical protein
MIDEIPITTQASLEIFIKPLPPEIAIGEISYETELLDDIEIADYYEYNSATGAVLPASNTSVPIFPALPRQTLEVLPEQKEENISGSVKLYLKINEIGEVIDHRILYNNLKCENCLSEIITAAYKSRWESGRNIGHPVEYWVEKTYSFY